MANGRRFVANVYGKGSVKLEINECKEDQFIWCPNCTRVVIQEVVVKASKIIRFNKVGMMVRA